MKIALMGYARCGKDTVYSLIKEELGKGTTRISFGDALREHFHESFPWIPRSPKPREYYEAYGEAMRGIDKDIWVKHLERRFEITQWFGNSNFVITDLRQPNELEWCKANGFTIVYIHADADIRQARSQGDTTWMSVNPSERFISSKDADHIIHNSTEDMEELRQQVRQLLEVIKK